MRHLPLLSLLGLSCCAPLAETSATREAPTPTANPVNQLSVAGNACGPAALLNSFRFGASHWHRAAEAVAGDSDRERMLSIMRGPGMRPSRHIPGRARWTRSGVGLSDLRDIAEEVTSSQRLPHLSEEVFILKSRETPEQLLRRVHHRMEKSLAAGFPPVISLRRLAWRSQKSGAPQWVAIDAHFVTIIALPRRLERNARSFAVRYVDPWGGRICVGDIAISAQSVFTNSEGYSACLEAWFPEAGVGKKHLKPAENSVLTVAAGLGKW